MSMQKNETNDNATRLSVYCPVGFHGDPYLMSIVDGLAAQCSQFIETGTEAGSTIGYTARMYPHLDCYSVETDLGTHELASYNLANHENVTLLCEYSLAFLDVLQPTSPALFWLDAHSHGWGCDLGKEVDIILSRWDSGYILLDDFEVPGRAEFGFDWYESYGKLNWETVAADISEEMKQRIGRIYYPNYTPPFATRGWVLIPFGDIFWEMPEFVFAVDGVVHLEKVTEQLLEQILEEEPTTD